MPVERRTFLIAPGFDVDPRETLMILYPVTFLPCLFSGLASRSYLLIGIGLPRYYQGKFLADRTNGRAYATVLRLSVCLSVCDVMYCG